MLDLYTRKLKMQTSEVLIEPLVWLASLDIKLAWAKVYYTVLLESVRQCSKVSCQAVRITPVDATDGGQRSRQAAHVVCSKNEIRQRTLG